MRITDLKILYEDNHLIAVIKPAGILVQGDASEDISLLDIVRGFLKDKYKKFGNVFVGLIHRLDRPVSGIVLFAKTSKGAARLSEQIRDRNFKKTYLVIIEGHMEPNQGTLRHNLIKDENKKMAFVSNDGEEAILEYETIKSGKDNSLLKINLITGRFHQIRAQLAAVGHPVLGDKKYGSSKSFKDKTITLCAAGIEFRPATGGEVISLSIEYPVEWNRHLK